MAASEGSALVSYPTSPEEFTGRRDLRRLRARQDSQDTKVMTFSRLAPQRPGFSTEAVQPPARVNVTWVTPLGEEVASTS
jgi:hypothetical protein